MEGDFRSKIKKQSEKTKYKSKRNKKTPGFAFDFTYYSKALKGNKKKNKPLQSKTGSKTHHSIRNGGLRTVHKGKSSKGLF
jgi:hypothetical protein